jgi:ribonuclease HI
MSEQELPEVTIYTDGACDPNPGPGGWGAVLLFPDGGSPRELSGGDENTTNNRMEMLAALEALKALPEPARVVLFTDSQYLCWGMKQLAAPGLFGGAEVGEGVKNGDLWQELARAAAHHRVECRWVRGHAGDRWNERAHALATKAVPTCPLPLDDDEAIHIFTAASCVAASGPCGWAVLLRYRQARKLLSGHEAEGSANRMHIVAVLRGLEAIKRPLPIHVYTTSEYLRDAINWIPGWQARDWRTTEGKAVSHRDLWEALVEQARPYTIRYHLVRPADSLEEMQEVKDLAAQEARTVTASS